MLIYQSLYESNYVENKPESKFKNNKRMRTEEPIYACKKDLLAQNCDFVYNESNIDEA